MCSARALTHRILIGEQVIFVHGVGRSLVKLHAGRRIQAGDIRQDAHLQLCTPPTARRQVS
jgi:hypothetical protein